MPDRTEGTREEIRLSVELEFDPQKIARMWGGSAADARDTVTKMFRDRLLHMFPVVRGDLKVCSVGTLRPRKGNKKQ